MASDRRDRLADSIDNLAGAIVGNTSERDDVAGWNYLGVCPECRAREDDVSSPGAPAPEQQKHLLA